MRHETQGEAENLQNNRLPVRVRPTPVFESYVMTRSRSKFGAEIRLLRRAKNLTLADVSEIVEISIVYLSDIERGNRLLDGRSRLVRHLAIAVGAEDDLENLIQLAAMDNGSVNIATNSLSNQAVCCLVKLSCNADRVSSETWNKIRTLLECVR